MFCLVAAVSIIGIFGIPVTKSRSTHIYGHLREEEDFISGVSFCASVHKVHKSYVDPCNSHKQKIMGLGQQSGLRLGQ